MPANKFEVFIRLWIRLPYVAKKIARPHELHNETPQSILNLSNNSVRLNEFILMGIKIFDRFWIAIHLQQQFHWTTYTVMKFTKIPRFPFVNFVEAFA